MSAGTMPQLEYTEYLPDAGSAATHTVVTLSSLGVSRRSWSIAGPALATRGVRCIAVDLNGHGTSPASPHFMTIEDFAGALAALIDALGLEQTALVGNSMGATICTELAVSRPELISHLVHVGSAVWDSEESRRQWLHSRSQIFCRPDGTVQEMTEEFVVGIFGAYDSERHALLKEDQERSGPRLHWAMWALYAYDVHAALQRVRQPVLAVFGENDPYQHQSLPILRRSVGHLDEVIIAGGSHLLPLDRGTELAGQITTWLQRTTSTPPQET